MSVKISGIKVVGRTSSFQENIPTKEERFNFFCRQVVIPRFLASADVFDSSGIKELDSSVEDALDDFEDQFKEGKVVSKPFAPDVFFVDLASDKSQLRRLTISKKSPDLFTATFSFTRKNENGNIEEVSLMPVEINLATDPLPL